MNFDIKDLPYAQFEKLGLNRKGVLNMKPEDLAAMLSGNRTSLLTFSVELTNGQRFETDAKLSLFRNPDNSLSLNVHPVRAQIKNDIGATPEEMEKLKTGGLLVRDHIALNGEREPHYFQLDRETNEILRARVRDFIVPSAIKDVVLSPDQKEQLRQGNVLEIKSKGGDEIIRARVDLNEPRGFTTKPEVLGQSESRGVGGSAEEVKPTGPRR
ncbi:uncharacterized protein DUF3945 [Pontibacter ummariensis]|uniref:DUF4099 domain-containing protein n=1 Tax=Pontibacter ummariensis TaxID=1610492 RepID=A0A239DT51_9BACT|nr:DUF4099 domain-containing protein [Pontibacter ummariensis]PRY13765.1 uncharacterized protein DUF3945 [Pontibacter ummariensis]SNS35680.1 Protein of unknown function [Pontibacter ummariensis]